VLCEYIIDNVSGGPVRRNHETYSECNSSKSHYPFRKIILYPCIV